MSRKKPGKVSEPIQVYLTPADRAMLDRVAKAAGVSRAEVLRRGIRRMSTEASAGEHPALKLIREMNALDWGDGPNDMAQRHDEYLAEIYMDNHEDKSE
ncbi:MAG: hypothetical protein AABZ80_04305 [Gemmatimonadota bacterium]